jgi:hypothetical protein
MGKFRTINGSDNNGDQGVAGAKLIRLFKPAFEDKNGNNNGNTPRGGEFTQSRLPNPRRISNIVIDQVQPVTNFLNASDWLWQWGQLIDHDFALNEASGKNPPKPEDITPIVVPHGDPTFPDGTTLPFIRVPAADGTGTGPDNPRQIDNQITAFIDASSVYGSDDKRAKFLRDNESGKGLLKTTIGNNGEMLLPLNDGTQANANGGGALGNFQFVAGDIRANEQIGLIAVHNLLVREHNRIALGLYDRLEAGEAGDELLVKFSEFRDEFVLENSNLSPAEALEAAKDEFLYQSARKVIGAKVQVITYEEFLPLLIGDTLKGYSGFNLSVSPQVSVEFANAAYRLGHTLLSNQLRRVDGNGITETSLANSFFKPEDVQEKGIDTLLAGLIFQGSQEVDNMVVDSVRNFLFEAGTGGLDLGAVNIARGRETGIPGYAAVYNELFGTDENLTPITSFADLRNLGLFSDPVVNLFETAYETVDQIDLWVGGISELPDDHGGLLGPTLSYFIADQFTRSRDGDRFFYLNDLDHLQILAPDLQNTTLADIIRRNAESSYLVPDHAFKVPFENSIFGDNTPEFLNGTSLDDLIDGKEGDDMIRGLQGNDILFGGDGNDYIRGDAGNNIVVGGDGNDFLVGGPDRDTVVGGVGNDALRGNGGANIFVFGSDIFRDPSRDVDIINNFQVNDTLDFTDYLRVGGTIAFERTSSHSLEIDLSGEDKIEVFGNQDALDQVIMNNILLF